MKTKNILPYALGAVLAVAALASTTVAWSLNGRLKQLQAVNSALKESLDKAHSIAVSAAEELEKAKAAARQDESSGGNAAGSRVSMAPKPAEMKVLAVEYNGQDELDLRLSERPDMDTVREYVFAGPVAKGVAAFRYTTKYNSTTRSHDPHLIVTGDFCHRTNLLLRVLKGFPACGKDDSGNPAAKPLAADYTCDFTREDAPPLVRFASRGRYLPPAGSRAIAVESVNVAKIRTEIRSVPSANIVQILALEEGRYSNISKSGWPNADEWLEDVAGRPVVSEIPTPNRLNESETTPVTVGTDPSSPSNGIYVVTVRSADLERRDRTCWWMENEKTQLNPNRYRLVCITDFGISARVAEGSVLVWVTSLTRGEPVEGAKIEIFSTAGTLAGTGECGVDGLCTVRIADGETPFAVVASAADGSDRSFMAIDDSMKVDETDVTAGREEYLKRGETVAFVWTDRGIYRHGETISLHAILRDGEGKAPEPFPVEVVLLNPGEDVVERKTLMPGEDGSISCDGFAVSAEQPSGMWEFTLSTPKRILGTRTVKIEEFAPPQIRVKATAAENADPTNFFFTVSAEHLYGGPAAALKAEGAIVFQDAAFKPAGWSGYTFGDSGRALKANFRRIQAVRLDAGGKARFDAPLWADTGKPAAAILATAEGTVFEDGGRPATARASAMMHYYPYYIGSTLSNSMRLPEDGFPSVAIACVAKDGSRLAGKRRLVAKVDRIEHVYSYRKQRDGATTWDCERVRTAAVENLAFETAEGVDTELELPLRECGDYAITVTDPETDASFGATFYLGSEFEGDGSLRASLSTPAKVSIATDKPFYRAGESPRLVVKSPFAGAALLSVLRDGIVYAESFALTNATSEIILRPAENSWAPNVDVSICVVQSAAGSGRGLAARAHGETTVKVRPLEREITVDVEPSYSSETRKVSARVSAPGAAWATVTLVDEGINLLTGEPVPDPVSRFAEARTGERPLFDLYHRIIPVLGDDILKASGVKTGGGAGMDMLGRVSPVPTRRFKPLALWRAKVPVEDGAADVEFDLPEFVGEVRVTAVAWNHEATGAGAAQCKVAPKLAAEPDAPRFVAPGDEFELTLPVANLSGARGEYDAAVAVGGSSIYAGRREIDDGATDVIRCRAKAPAEPGEIEIKYTVAGFGEKHETTIALPVRPAVPWLETAGVEILHPGESWALPEGKRMYTVSGSRLAELKKAIDYLAEYPHGCLEQTSSRIFPLISAGGILNSAADGGSKPKDMAEFVAAGVKRVESMMRANDFVMWPDCTYAPWDAEVSLYAAHFLVEAEKAGAELKPGTKEKVVGWLSKWALSPTNSVAAYACHTLALAGSPDKDRMLRLYDSREKLDLLSRARLARAFAAAADRKRAADLVANAESPDSVKEAAFLVLALLELDPEDERLPALVNHILARRDKSLFCWGTTTENAHALLAAGEYFRHHPPKRGEPSVSERAGKLVNEGAGDAFIAWRSLSLASAEACTNESSAISLSRTFLDADGNPANLADLSRGALVVVELKIKSAESRDYSDLVVEDLFAGAFEPVHGGIEISLYPWLSQRRTGSWIMRSDARDDRMLVFSKKFHMEAGDEVAFYYPLRVVTAGGFALPCASVEAMYMPRLRARCGTGRVVVRD